MGKAEAADLDVTRADTGRTEPGDDLPAAESKALRRSERLRLRAAWMYYVEEMTQSAIADALGIGRVTVVRLLSDARALHEVKISLRAGSAELPGLEFALQRAFDIGEVIVAPLSRPEADPTAAIGAATGQYLTSILRDGMSIGAGWGRTLLSSLEFIDEKPLADVTIVSLLGGIAKARRTNPTEFAWQLARLLHADCHLMSAPALVNSVETKRALIDHCGLGEIFARAERLDAVLLSVGEMAASATTYRYGYFSEADRLSLIEAGAVGEVLYHFLDAEGRLVDHPINTRVMAVPIETIRQTPIRVLASGGVAKADALIAGIRMTRPTVFITDEVSAQALAARLGIDPAATGGAA